MSRKSHCIQLLVSMSLAFGVGACGKSEEPSATPATAVAQPTTLAVTPETAGLVFRYRDPATGAVASATTIEAIPEAAREAVVVFHPTEAPPPGADFVANVTGAPPWQAKSVAGFAFAAPPIAAAADVASATEVVLFATEWCGYCKKARKYFQSHKIPFSEYDIENDRKAEPRLAELAKKAGVSRDSMSGVPIIFIGGKLLRGWDVGEAERLLAGNRR